MSQVAEAVADENAPYTGSQISEQNELHQSQNIASQPPPSLSPCPELSAVENDVPKTEICVEDKENIETLLAVAAEEKGMPPKRLSDQLSQLSQEEPQKKAKQQDEEKMPPAVEPQTERSPLAETAF